MPLSLDRIDVSILKSILEDGRKSFRQISRDTGITTPTVSDRMPARRSRASRRSSWTRYTRSRRQARRASRALARTTLRSDGARPTAHRALGDSAPARPRRTISGRRIAARRGRGRECASAPRLARGRAGARHGARAGARAADRAGRGARTRGRCARERARASGPPCIPICSRAYARRARPSCSSTAADCASGYASA